VIFLHAMVKAPHTVPGSIVVVLSTKDPTRTVLSSIYAHGDARNIVGGRKDTVSIFCSRSCPEI
jgi:ADP-ribosylglycohydrolase